MIGPYYLLKIQNKHSKQLISSLRNLSTQRQKLELKIEVEHSLENTSWPKLFQNILESLLFVSNTNQNKRDVSPLSSRRITWKFRFDAFLARPLNFSLRVQHPRRTNVHPPSSSDQTGFRVTRISGFLNPVILFSWGTVESIDS